MHFANPGVLWALFLLIIPILIHLFKFRRYKQVPFPSIRFLQKIDQDQKAKRRLKDILILISRLLVLAALVFAFAMPFSGKSKVLSKGNVISIYVDNSFSMENESDQGKLLDLAKKKAEELALTFQPSDRFQLLTNDLETKHQRLVDRQAFLQFLYEVDLSAASVNMSEIYRRQLSILEKEEDFDKWIALISDMQRSTADLDNIINSEDSRLLFIPIEADSYTNVYIDSLWFEDPVRQLDKAETLFMRIVNESDQNIDELPIRLEINGQMKSMATIAIEAGSVKDTLLHFNNSNIAGMQNGLVSVEDKPIEFDNAFYFSYKLKEKINVIEIKGDKAAPYYQLLYTDSLYTFSSYSVDQIDYTALADADLIILNDLNLLPSGLNSFMLKWLEEGGHLFISPGEKIDAAEYNAFLNKVGASVLMPLDTNQRRVSYIAMDNEIFKGVLKAEPEGKALPSTRMHYRYQFNDLLWSTIFQLQGKDSFLSGRKVQNGRLYVLAVASNENWSNWPRHALFITSMLRIAEESQRSAVLANQIGDWNIIEIPAGENTQDRPLELKAQDGSIAFIPGQQWLNGKWSIGVKDEINNAGFYDLMQDDELMYTLAFNYSRKESDLRFYNTDDIDSWMEDKTSVRLIEAVNAPIKKSSISDERPLWKYFIIIALIFLVMEVIIIKIMKGN
jgi:hypothetical protein